MIRLTLLLCAYFLLFSCGGSAEVTGSGTGVGNGITISGIVQDAQAKPLSGIAVELVQSSYLPTDEYFSRADIYTQTSGNGGNFQFTEIPGGSYNLWARAETGEVGVKYLELDEDLNAVSVDNITLEAPKPHSVKFNGVSSGEVVLRLYGSTVYDTVAVNDVATLALPVGQNRINCSLPGYETLSGDSILLVAEDTVEIYFLKEGDDSYSYETDSLIVKQILSENSLDSLTVDEVTYAPFDDDGIGKRVQRLHLDSVAVIPELTSRLRQLRLLEMIDGTIETVPQSLGNLVYLERLDLRNNSLQTLPRELLSLENLDSVYVEGNPLDSLPSDMKAWLNELDD